MSVLSNFSIVELEAQLRLEKNLALILTKRARECKIITRVTIFKT